MLYCIAWEVGLALQREGVAACVRPSLVSEYLPFLIDGECGALFVVRHVILCFECRLRLAHLEPLVRFKTRKLRKGGEVVDVPIDRIFLRSKIGSSRSK